MEEIELNKPYTAEELCKILHISHRQWYNHRDRVEDYWDKFFKWKVQLYSHKANYIITEILAPWEDMPSRSTARQIDSFYTKETHKVIKNQNWNSGSNVARKILKNNNRFSHQQITAEKYVRPILNRDYTKSQEVRWMRLDEATGDYVELTGEQYAYLKELFNDKDLIRKPNTYLEYLVGNISKDEACEQLFEEQEYKWTHVFKEFRREFGFTPVYTRQYLEAAFKE